MLANETMAMIYPEAEAFNDRELFVYNLGLLLSQTGEGIKGAELSKDDIVTVTHRDGHKKHIDVRLDSYMAIIRDVTKNYL